MLPAQAIEHFGRACLKAVGYRVLVAVVPGDAYL
jgi:hypothetical protein